MTEGVRVAIVGATGAVGQELIALCERPLGGLSVQEIVPIASDRSVAEGRTVQFRGQSLPVRALADEAFAGCRYAFFSAGGSLSKAWVPRAVAAGCVVIDNSSAFRMEPDVPLVVPEVNAAAAQQHKGIIANPNCTTAIFLTGVAALHRHATLRRVVACTYQAVSGAGAKAIAELAMQVTQDAAAQPLETSAFPKPIAFNVLPQVDTFLDTGFTREEMKLTHESHKILGVTPESLAVSATCVRVPVRRCHAIACHLDFEKPLDAATARRLIAEAPGVEVHDGPAAGVYATPLEQEGVWPVAVSRIRRDPLFENGLACWLVGDQLLKGAALNAVQIAALLEG